jgi:hypothetical protein
VVSVVTITVVSIVVFIVVFIVEFIVVFIVEFIVVFIVEFIVAFFLPIARKMTLRCTVKDTNPWCKGHEFVVSLCSSHLVFRPLVAPGDSKNDV